MLRLAPGHFRDRFGAEYLATVDERMAASASRGAALSLRLAIREVLGSLNVVLRLRLGFESRRGHRTMDRKGGESMMKTVVQDLVQAGKTLRRNPGFTLAAVAVLGSASERTRPSSRR